MDWALIGAKKPDKLPIFENPPGRNFAQKEDVSRETRTYGNPTPFELQKISHRPMAKNATSEKFPPIL